MSQDAESYIDTGALEEKSVTSEKSVKNGLSSYFTVKYVHCQGRLKEQES